MIRFRTGTTMANSLSLCMIIKNEGKFLSDCLESVKSIADQIIIVDTGSSDESIKIAQGFGGNVFPFEWTDDFSAARNESLSHATKDWILVLDADEILSVEDCKKIKELMGNVPHEVIGFSLEQRSYVLSFEAGAVKNNSSFAPVSSYPFYVPNNIVRLFQNHQGITFRHRVHELVEDSIGGKGKKIAKSGCIIHHFGSVKEKEMVQQKARYYTTLIEKQYAEHPKIPRYAYQMARASLGEGNIEKALRHFQETAVLNPRYKLVFSEIAKLHLKKGRNEDALDCFRKSMELHPDNPSPANNLAAVYLSIGKYAEAKKVLEDVLKKHPQNPALLHNFDEALKGLQKKHGGTTA